MSARDQFGVPNAGLGESCADRGMLTGSTGGAEGADMNVECLRPGTSSKLSLNALFGPTGGFATLGFDLDAVVTVSIGGGGGGGEKIVCLRLDWSSPTSLMALAVTVACGGP